MLTQAVEVVSIGIGVIALLRGVRNASKAWDQMVNSMERLNEKISWVIEEKEKEHREMKRDIRALKHRNEGN